MRAMLVAVGALLSPLVLAPPPPKAAHRLGQNTLPPPPSPSFDYRDHLREHILPQVFYFRSRAMFRRAHASRTLPGSPLLMRDAPARRHDISDSVWLVTSSEDQASEDEAFDQASQDVPVDHAAGGPELAPGSASAVTKMFEVGGQRLHAEKSRTSPPVITETAEEASSTTKDKAKLLYASDDTSASSREGRPGGSSHQGSGLALPPEEGKDALPSPESSLVVSQQSDYVLSPNRSSSAALPNQVNDGQSSNQQSDAGLLNPVDSSTALGSDKGEEAAFIDGGPNDRSTDSDRGPARPLDEATSGLPISDHQEGRHRVSSHLAQTAQSGPTAPGTLTTTATTTLQDSASVYSQASVAAAAAAAAESVQHGKTSTVVLASQRNGFMPSNHQRINAAALPSQPSGAVGSEHVNDDGANLPAGTRASGIVLPKAGSGLLANGGDSDVELSKMTSGSTELTQGGASGSPPNPGTRVVLTSQGGGGGGGGGNGAPLKNPTVQDKPRPPDKPVIHRELNLDHRPLEGLPQLMDEVEQKFAEMGDVVDSSHAQQLAKVMAAWDAHRKKVEEGLGLDDAEDIADRRPALQTTTTPSAASTFQLFGTSRRVVGRSWRRIASRLFPDSLKKMLLIFPGTIWCGAGNKANNDTERLGAHNETDACCREHDLNSDYIGAGQVAPDYGNIHNKYSFTMSSCESDSRFRECLLRNVAGNGSDSSEAVGYLYFTIIKPKCFMKTSATTTAPGGNCTEAKERCGRSISSDLEPAEWTIRENPDFPEPDPRNRLLDAVLAALSTIRYLFPRGLAESSGSIPLFG